MSSRSSSLSPSQWLSDVAATSKFSYKADQQVKFLHLQAEVELLLQQLQFLKQQRIATASYDGSNNRH